MLRPYTALTFVALSILASVSRAQVPAFLHFDYFDGVKYALRVEVFSGGDRPLSEVAVWTDWHVNAEAKHVSVYPTEEAWFRFRKAVQDLSWSIAQGSASGSSGPAMSKWYVYLEYRDLKVSSAGVGDVSLPEGFPQFLAAVRDLTGCNLSVPEEEEPNQALQTTPMTRSVYEKTIEVGHLQRGV